MTFEFTEVSVPYKFIPRSCVQPIPRESILKGQYGQILFMSRWRNGKTEVAMIDEQAIRLKAGLFNELIDEYREENDQGREVMINLFAVDLKIMKRFFEQDEFLENSIHDYCKLMDIGWKYQIESMYISAANFFKNLKVLKFSRESALHTPERLREVMKAIRYRVCTTKQAQCLDLILDYELNSFPRAGAFLTHAFLLKEEHGFEHELHFHLNLLNPENHKTARLNCCTHPRPFIINYTKPPMYCSLCQKISIFHLNMLKSMPRTVQPVVKNRIMDHPKRSIDRTEALHIDLSSRGESSSFYSNRSQSGGYEPFVPSPGSSIGASVSMLSSRNSEAGTGDHDELEGSRTILMHVGIADMIADKEIQQRYPGFHQFLLNENPTWFEPAPCNGKTYCVPQKAAAPENHRKLRKEANYEMLDLMFRFYREKYVNAYRKRENKELLEANKKIQVSAVQMFAKAEQEEEYISNNLFKKIQQLSQERDNLAKKYQKDQEVLTEDLIADVAKIPDVHAQETEKLMADKQAEIERLRTICSRTEKNYQEELMRLRSEKVEHESALEQEQELLINTLGKRMSQMTEEKRKMQQTLEQAYLQGFVQYDETVEAALHASSTNKNGNSNSVLPASCTRTAESQPFQSRQQFNEADFLHIENKRLAGMYSLEKRRCDESIIQIQKLNYRMAKMEAMMDSVRPECFSPDGTLEGRLNALCCEQCFNNKPACKKRHGNSPPTAAVRAQPSSSRSVPTPNTENAHPSQQASATAHAAPILATVFPTQRSTPARAERQ